MTHDEKSQKKGDKLIAGMIELVDVIEGVQDDLEPEIPRFFVEELGGEHRWGCWKWAI